jgi:hypothetical protein
VYVCVCERERGRELDWGKYEIDNMRTKEWGLFFFTAVRQQKLTLGDEVC